MKIKIVCVLAAVSFLLAVWVFPAPAPTVQIVRANSAPQITQVIVHCDITPCSEFDIRGAHFGAAQGARRLLIDGLQPIKYEQWSDTQISVVLPQQVYNHTYKYGIYEGLTRISNSYEKTGACVIWLVTPAKASAGTQIDLFVIGCGPTQGAKYLKMGITPMTIVSWTADGASAAHIKATVPFLRPGIHPITLYDGAKLIAGQGGGQTFTII